ncbi:MAG: hypothetical protein DDT19_02103 [Syntrophomonadaceae bacterium]|nr:hypothetical protein [Bacillota bacterium]
MNGLLFAGLGQPKKEKAVKLQVFYRTAKIEREEIDEGNRIVELTFSSEMPLERYFGIEILEHKKGSVRLDRIKKAGNLLVQHNQADIVGVVEEAYISPDLKGKARVRFGKSARAEEIFQDVLDGIRTNVSVGYLVHKVVTEKTDEKPAIYRVVDWEPVEISLVSIPADISIGVGREFDTTVITREEKMMCEKCSLSPCACNTRKIDSVDIEKIKADTRGAEMSRVREILAVGEQHNCKELAEKAIRDGTSLEAFRQVVLESVYKAKPIDTLNPEIGMSKREIGEFSIVRAIRALMEPKTNPKEIAPFEMEASEAVARKIGKKSQGFFIPYDVGIRSRLSDMGLSRDSAQRIVESLISRDLERGTGASGGFLVATDLLVANFIELLRNAMMVRRLGAQVLGGLVGDVAIPRQTGGATAFWVAESGAPAESRQTFAQLGLTPKTCGAFTDISRKLILQSSIDVEAFVRADLATVIALAIDLAAINGTGVHNQPRGILNTTGIGDVPIAVNGGPPTYTHIVSLWRAIAVANAAVGNMAFLTNAIMIGRLLSTPKVAGHPVYIVEELPNAEGMTTMLGMRAGMSNQVPSNLVKGTSTDCSAIICGNWSDLIIAEWGTLDVLVDPYTGGAAGTVRVRVLQDVDIAIRNAASFAVIRDARDV